MAFIVPEEIEKYAALHSTSPSPLLNDLEKETRAKMEMAQMLTGPLEGGFLKMLIQVTGAKKALEIGMFTGYGTLNMAEGLPEEGEIYTCEIDEKRIEFAKKFFSKSPHGKKIRVMEGPGLASMKKFTPPFDFIFIDADKGNYPHYYEEAVRLLKSGGLIAVDNALWSGEVLNPKDEDTRAIDQLNKRIKNDSRVESVMLTIRDGIHLVRKK